MTELPVALRSLLDFASYGEKDLEKSASAVVALEAEKAAVSEELKNANKLLEDAVRAVSDIQASINLLYLKQTTLAEDVRKERSFSENRVAFLAWMDGASAETKELQQKLLNGDVSSVTEMLKLVDTSQPITITHAPPSVKFTSKSFYLVNNLGASLDGMRLGPFVVEVKEIRKHWGSTVAAYARPTANNYACIPSYDDEPEDVEDDHGEMVTNEVDRHFHPHIGTDHLCCLGDIADSVKTSLLSGNVLAVLHLMSRFLSAYYEDGPPFKRAEEFDYSAEDFVAASCSICGEPNYCTCPSCDSLPVLCARCHTEPTTEACNFCGSCCAKNHIVTLSSTGVPMHAFIDGELDVEGIWEENYRIFASGLAADLGSNA